MAKKKKKQTPSKLGTILLVIIISIYGLYADQLQETFGLSKEPSSQEVSSDLKVYFLDVGQADSILIQNQSESMLIDAGNNEDGPLLVEYFQSLGITNFKYLVGTHPHEDHIGGLDDIINQFSTETLYLPDVITTTSTFTDVLDALEKNNMTYTVPHIDETFQLGEATIQVLYTGTDTSDLNNTSIVLKLTFGNISFLFTGDATSKTENQILTKDIKADILKVGHHGSKYSSTENFLDQVNPQYAIISVGTNNSYDHPHEEILKKFHQRNIDILRTDELGTILITTDGNQIKTTYLETNTNGGKS